MLVADTDDVATDLGETAGEQRHLAGVAGPEEQHIHQPHSRRIVDTSSRSARSTTAGVAVADDHVAVALVRPRRPVAGARQVHVDDRRLRRLADAVEAVGGDDRPSGALRPEVRGADGVATLRRVEAVLDRQPGPRRVHVDVVGERHQRHELRAGRTGADLADGERAIGAAEPLHVRQAGAQAERGHRVVAEADDVGVLRPVDVPRQHHAPLDPRVRRARRAGSAGSG